MRKIDYWTVAKSDWPEGPWKTEPDKMQWSDETTGLPCLIVRNGIGALCGYVGVGPDHPLYGENGAMDLDVHGGITFTGRCQPGHESEAICHVPDPGESDNVWWLGFDCAHVGDLCPDRSGLNGTYRTISYVAEQVTHLAIQLERHS